MPNKHDTCIDKLQDEYLEYLRSSVFKKQLESFINDMKLDKNANPTMLAKLTELTHDLVNDTNLDKNAETFCYWN